MADTPIRQEPIPGALRRRESIARACVRCDADFLDLAPGKTGERGLWTECGRWYCSQQCHDEGSDR